MRIARPSQREIFSKVEKAAAAIACGNKQVAPLHHLSCDLEDCCIDDEADLWEKLPKLPDELKKSDPIKCYAWGRPAKPSWERELGGLELWAHHWNSTIMGCKIYLKFSIKIDGGGEPHYLHARLHPDRPNRKAVI